MARREANETYDIVQRTEGQHHGPQLLTPEESERRMAKGRLRITVSLNGTEKNPHARYDLTQNPFPPGVPYEQRDHILHLQQLGGEPIPDVSYIREHLKGWSDEFVELCCSKFKKGEVVIFDVGFPL